MEAAALTWPQTPSQPHLSVHSDDGMSSGLTHLMSMPWLSSSSSMKSSLLITSFPVLVLQPFVFQPWTQLVIPREHMLTLIHQEGLASRLSSQWFLSFRVRAWTVPFLRCSPCSFKQSQSPTFPLPDPIRGTRGSMHFCSATPAPEPACCDP